MLKTLLAAAALALTASIAQAEGVSYTMDVTFTDGEGEVIYEETLECVVEHGKPCIVDTPTISGDGYGERTYRFVAYRTGKIGNYLRYLVEVNGNRVTGTPPKINLSGEPETASYNIVMGGLGWDIDMPRKTVSRVEATFTR